jgi:hypothetical protein
MRFKFEIETDAEIEALNTSVNSKSANRSELHQNLKFINLQSQI